MNKDKIEKKLNIFLTIIIVVCAIVCFNVLIQRVQGKDASFLGFRFYHILTGSMEPTIKTGTNVLVKEINPDKLEAGDIITFISRDSNIYGNANTHRILSIETDENGRKYFVTKGDANNTADSVRVYPEDVKGKVIFHMKNSGFAVFYKFVCTGYGFCTVVMLPLMLVCWFVTKDFKRQVEEYKAENKLKEAENAEKSEAKSDGKSDGTTE